MQFQMESRWEVLKLQEAAQLQIESRRKFAFRKTMQLQMEPRRKVFKGLRTPVQLQMFLHADIV